MQRRKDPGPRAGACVEKERFCSHARRYSGSYPSRTSSGRAVASQAAAAGPCLDPARRVAVEERRRFLVRPATTKCATTIAASAAVTGGRTRASSASGTARQHTEEGQREDQVAGSGEVDGPSVATVNASAGTAITHAARSTRRAGRRRAGSLPPAQNSREDQESRRRSRPRPTTGSAVPHPVNRALSASADPHVETVAQHDVRPPERDSNHGDSAERGEGIAQAARRRRATKKAWEASTSAPHESAAAAAKSPAASAPRPSVPALERSQQRKEREEAREEKQAVHAPVDPVEDQHPSAGGQERGDNSDSSTREALTTARSAVRSQPRTPGRQPATRSARRQAARRPTRRRNEAGRPPLSTTTVEQVAERMRPTKRAGPRPRAAAGALEVEEAGGRAAIAAPPIRNSSPKRTRATAAPSCAPIRVACALSRIVAVDGRC